MTLVDTGISSAHAWNTWSDRPAEMVFLPLGTRVTPVLYSTAARKATTIAAPDGIRFGHHDVDGTRIDFEASHAGTRLGFSYAKPDPSVTFGEWKGIELKEWGLRFWVTICLSAESGETVRYIEEDGAAVVEIGRHVVALVTGETPVQVTGHDSVEALAADFETHGYFHLGSRASEATVIALRFNLEMMRQGRFAAAVADDRSQAIEMARAALASPDASPAPLLHTGRNAGALDAVRDVVGWNTLYDRINRRRTTAISRIWNLGDFAVWYNDQTYAALLAGLFDGRLARENFAIAMASATPAGNFACLLTSRDSWVDRSQPPNGAFVAWTMYLRSRDRSLLDLAYEPLAKNQRWWRANRDPDRRGLVSCGTSDVGSALYKGTHFGARNETGMDNSATHDEAVYEPETRTLSTFDLGLNCQLALDAEMLGRIARELGRDGEAAEFEALAEDSRAKIRTELWDETRGLFANRQRKCGFVRSVGPTSFYPLLCGAATAEQATRLLAHLADPETFGGDFVIPNAARSDPAYADNVYWRGRIWPNVNFFVWQGLKRYGFDAEASALARKSLALFEQCFNERRLCGENYSAETGEILDQPDTDPFYTWGAMLPLMGVSEVMDVDPWNGWQIVNTGEDLRLGPLASPIGMVTLRVEDGVLTLAQDGETVFSTDFRGRMSEIVVESGFVSMRLDGDLYSEKTFSLGEHLSHSIAADDATGLDFKRIDDRSPDSEHRRSFQRRSSQDSS